MPTSRRKDAQSLTLKLRVVNQRDEDAHCCACVGENPCRAKYARLIERDRSQGRKHAEFVRVLGLTTVFPDRLNTLDFSGISAR